MDNIVLRPHQKECVDAIFCNDIKKGKICLPTGTGKTYIEAEIIAKLIKQDTHKAMVIVSPRILLSYQLLKEVAEYLTKQNIQACYMNVNSGMFSSSEIDKSMNAQGLQAYGVESTTSFSDIRERHIQCQLKDIPLVIVSTYDSVAQIQKANIPVEVYCFDESHNLVGTAEFFEATGYDSNRKYYFTATPKETNSNHGRGMNNTELYGGVIYQKTPREMIEAGEMAKPIIHIVSAVGADVNTDGSYDYKSIFQAIDSAYSTHEWAVAQQSAAPDTIRAKMLVVMEGQRQLEGIWETPEFRDFIRNNPEVKIFALSTDFGIVMPNESGKYQKAKTNNRNKEEFLRRIHKLSPLDRAIIFHIDMIGEGLDCPGITGVMPFRNVSQIPFLQNLGRSTRLVTVDKRRLYNGEIKPMDFAKYVKPYAFLILPVFTANALDYKERYSGIVRAFRSNYKFSPAEIVIIANRNTATNLEDFDETGIHEREIRSVLHELRDFVHTIEKEEQLEIVFDTFFRVNSSSDENKGKVFVELFKEQNLLQDWT